MDIIYKNISQSVAEKKKLLAVLIDPDKMIIGAVSRFIKQVNTTVVTHIFVGGSTVEANATEAIIDEIKKYTDLPIVIFPGDTTQISENADGLLFLSLISGQNPDYLIGKHINAVSKLRQSRLEIIPTGYILIENGKQTAVERVTHTDPISREDKQLIVDTAKAGELLGMKLIYLEAGSGALHPVSSEIISWVKDDISIPLIVGGGIKSKEELKKAYDAGADLVVIGTALENDNTFFEELKNTYEYFG